MIDYISHIQSPLTEQDYNLFIKAVSEKGNEAAALIWIDWYFDFTKNPKNKITTEQKNKMIEAIEKNKFRILKALKK